MAYGWTEPHSCTEYEWRYAHFPQTDDDKYDTEHILEWFVITNFFTTLDGQYKQDEFTHPDPQEDGAKINFCRYWRNLGIFRANKRWTIQHLSQERNLA